MTESASASPAKVRLLAVTIVVSMVGFLLGSRPRPDEVESIALVSQPNAEEAAPARTNEELVVSPWRHSKSFSLTATLPTPSPDPAARGDALTRRQQRRAFLAAPPTIPHPVSQGTATECRSCHEHGATIGTRVAPPMSHPVMAMCTQCHVPETSVFATASSPAATVGSDFESLSAGAAIYQYGSETPPQVPHSRWMRQRCSSCHGPLGHTGLQTSHPERLSCEQCHTSSAQTNQKAARD